MLKYREKSVWLDLRELRLENLLNDIEKLSFEYMVVPSDRHNFKRNNLKKVVFLDNLNEKVIKNNNIDVIIFNGKTIDCNILETIKKNGKEIGLFFELSSKKDLEMVVEKSKLSIDYIVIDNKKTTNIPIEYILARLQNSKIKNYIYYTRFNQCGYSL